MVGLLTSVMAVALAGWAETGLQGIPGHEQTGTEVVLMGAALVSWAAPGVVLTVLRPQIPLGWLLLVIGGSGAGQLGLAAYGSHGATADPDWPAAAAVAAVAGGAHVPSLFALPTVVLALYPSGRLGVRWLRRPEATAAVSIGTPTAAFDPDAYDASSPAAPRHWPYPRQLAWMLSVPAGVVGTSFFTGPLVRAALAVLVPVAVAVLRYRMLGIEPPAHDRAHRRTVGSRPAARRTPQS